MSSTAENAAAPSEPPPDETPNQRQARLRRERRQAKINAEGSSRLAAITNLSGRGAPEPAPSADSNRSHQQHPASSPEHPDPEEIDISEHHYQPRLNPRPASQDGPGWSTPQPATQQQQQPPPGLDDPMLRMLQQVMGGDSNTDPTAGLPPAMRNLFGAALQDEQQAQPQNSSTTTNLWRVVHALVSLALAGYVVLTSGFTGSKAARDRIRTPGVADGDHFVQRLFLYFATIEVVLQSSRYFLDRGQLPQSGVMGALSRMLPEPYAGYLRIAGRYSIIYSTLVSDAMVIIFVLGAVAWWNDAADV